MDGKHFRHIHKTGEGAFFIFRKIGAKPKKFLVLKNFDIRTFLSFGDNSGNLDLYVLDLVNLLLKGGHKNAIIESSILAYFRDKLNQIFYLYLDASFESSIGLFG